MLKAFKIFTHFVLQKINLTSNCCKGNNNLHCHGDMHAAASVTIARIYGEIMKST